MRPGTAACIGIVAVVALGGLIGVGAAVLTPRAVDQTQASIIAKQDEAIRAQKEAINAQQRLITSQRELIDTQSAIIESYKRQVGP